jgi:hypothetical protein
MVGYPVYMRINQSTKPPHYSSYLLRIWHAEEGEPQGWRVSLQNLGTGERLGFATLESLFAFFETARREESTQANGNEQKEATEQAEMNTKLDT